MDQIQEEDETPSELDTPLPCVSPVSTEPDNNVESFIQCTPGLMCGIVSLVCLILLVIILVCWQQATPSL